MSTAFIAATVPAKIVQASHTTLFHIALREAGDAMQWVEIAELNELVDPWITGSQDILIPNTFPPIHQTGILGL